MSVLPHKVQSAASGRTRPEDSLVITGCESMIRRLDVPPFIETRWDRCSNLLPAYLSIAAGETMSGTRYLHLMLCVPNTLFASSRVANLIFLRVADVRVSWWWKRRKVLRMKQKKRPSSKALIGPPRCGCASLGGGVYSGYTYVLLMYSVDFPASTCGLPPELNQVSAAGRSNGIMQAADS